MAIAPERQRKEDYNRWRQANAKNCSRSSSQMVKHMKQLSFQFFKGTMALKECKNCKYNKEDSRYSARICMACLGDADAAYNKVFAHRDSETLVCQN